MSGNLIIDNKRIDKRRINKIIIDNKRIDKIKIEN